MSLQTGTDWSEPTGADKRAACALFDSYTARFQRKAREGEHLLNTSGYYILDWQDR